MVDFNELRKPFKTKELDWRFLRSGVKDGKPWAQVLAYVTARAVQNRLDRVVGPSNWATQIVPNGDGFLYGIGIRVDDQWVWKWDGSDETKIEGVKGGISGGFKRAAVLWGIGRYLYYLGNSWAVFDERGSNSDKIGDTYYRWNPPDLPKWALPEGSESKTQLSPGPGASTAAEKTQKSEGSSEGQDENVQPGGNTEAVNENESQQIDPPGDMKEKIEETVKGANQAFVDLWFKDRFARKKGPGLQKELKRAIDDGTFGALVREGHAIKGVPIMTAIELKWQALYEAGEFSEGYTFEKALKNFGYKSPPSTPSTQEVSEPVTEEDITEMFTTDPGPPAFNKWMAENELEKPKVYQLLLDTLEKKRDQYSDVKELMQAVIDNNWFEAFLNRYNADYKDRTDL